MPIIEHKLALRRINVFKPAGKQEYCRNGRYRRHPEKFLQLLRFVTFCKPNRRSGKNYYITDKRKNGATAINADNKTNFLFEIRLMSVVKNIVNKKIAKNNSAEYCFAVHEYIIANLFNANRNNPVQTKYFFSETEFNKYANNGNDKIPQSKGNIRKDAS